MIKITTKKTNTNGHFTKDEFETAIRRPRHILVNEMRTIPREKWEKWVRLANCGESSQDREGRYRMVFSPVVDGYDEAPITVSPLDLVSIWSYVLSRALGHEELLGRGLATAVACLHGAYSINNGIWSSPDGLLQDIAWKGYQTTLAQRVARDRENALVFRKRLDEINQSVRILEEYRSRTEVERTPNGIFINLIARSVKDGVGPFFDYLPQEDD